VAARAVAVRPVAGVDDRGRDDVTPGLTDARTAVEAASAEETARITATLIRVTGD
jgi:hypothetical protein